MKDPEQIKHEKGAGKSGSLFILSAPSGAGKTTLCRAVRRRFSDLRYSISYSTRKPRQGERNGHDYHFIGKDEFEKGIADHQWAEWAVVHGCYYGTSAEFIDRELAAGHDTILDIDVQGTHQIIERYPDAVTIFVLPPSMEILRKRLKLRDTDSAEEIKRRLLEAEKEMAQKDLYRHVIVNDQLATALEALVSIIQRYRLKEEAS